MLNESGRRVYSPTRHLGISSCPHILSQQERQQELSRVGMLDRRAGAGSDRLKSMHLVLLVFKSNWRPRKDSQFYEGMFCSMSEGGFVAK